MPDYNIALKSFLGAHDTIIQVNLETGELLILKSINDNFPANTQISTIDFLHQCFDINNIHPDDIYKFENILSLSELSKKARANDNGTLFSFRHYKEGIYHWIQIVLLIPEDYSSSNPHVLICTKYLTTNNADLTEVLESYSQHIYKIVKCNLSTGDFRIIKQRTSEHYIHREYITYHTLHEEWRIEESLIHPDDLSRFRYYTNHTVILKHFATTHQFLCCFYRRKIGSIYKWVRLSITPATEYTSTNRIFTYIIEDVDRDLYILLEKQIHVDFDQQNPYLSNVRPSDIYVDNLMYIMPYFTQRYTDCYMIDLKKDMYIMYKINPETVTGNVPYTGTYSDFFRQYILTSAASDTTAHPETYGDVSQLKKLLMDKSSIEYIFPLASGHLRKMLFTKLESENGVPTKAICCTLPYTAEGLLKVKTFGNFDVYDSEGHILHFKKKQSKQLLAYLIDRQGFPVSPKDIAVDVLEKAPDDLNAIKYVSTLSRLAIKDLAAAGYTEIIIKEWNSLRVNVDKLDCDYYHLIGGDASYYHLYHNEYMKEYSWAEETNAEILHFSSR